MTVAQTAWDLQRYSKGRFVLGLGSQVKAHVLHRFSMPWTNHPAGQMRDYLGALRAIWSAWQDRTPLRYYSRHYHHTLMTPFFDPGPLPWGPPKLYLAAVGPQMTRLAGELADGVILHAFTTPRYVTEVTKPALATARRIDVHLLALIITGETDADLARARDAVRSQIAFYGSTPTYRGVLELHGWAELADRLSQALAAGPQAFATLGDLVPDEVVDAFAVTARPCDLAAALHQRWSGLVDSLAYYAPYPTPPGLWDPVARELARLAAAADLRRT